MRRILRFTNEINFEKSPPWKLTLVRVKCESKPNSPKHTCTQVSRTLDRTEYFPDCLSPRFEDHPRIPVRGFIEDSPASVEEHRTSLCSEESLLSAYVLSDAYAYVSRRRKDSLWRTFPTFRPFFLLPTEIILVIMERLSVQWGDGPAVRAVWLALGESV